MKITSLQVHALRAPDTGLVLSEKAVKKFGEKIL